MFVPLSYPVSLSISLSLFFQQATVTIIPSPSPDSSMSSRPPCMFTRKNGRRGGTARKVLSCTNVVGFARAACHLRDTQSALAFLFLLSYVIPDVFQSRTSNSGPSSCLSVGSRPPFSVHRRAENRIRDSRISTFTPFARILEVKKEQEEGEEEGEGRAGTGGVRRFV